MSDSNSPSADDLTQRIGVLTRREVEARILSPIIDALGEEFGRDQVIDIVRKTIVRVAQEQGALLAEQMGGSGSHEFMDSLQYWTKDNALEIELLAHDEQTLDFNVTRCRYAELYRSLGIPELGATLSCNRDFALIDGFNKDATLSRTQTIMEGAEFCNFRYKFNR
ncbi:MAG: L-2-amino-thiazoline-4-carboxylic acid hydrolase [Ardenticatenaceae bacterium]|nr:L-2-amino-thiazoline-4-carboxylic acid hydrolase [Ardenticatenaceae bacterium]